MQGKAGNNNVMRSNVLVQVSSGTDEESTGAVVKIIPQVCGGVASACAGTIMCVLSCMLTSPLQLEEQPRNMTRQGCEASSMSDNSQGYSVLSVCQH